jgi:hypothetical protein
MPIAFESTTAQLETTAVSSTVVSSIPGGSNQLYIATIFIYTDGGSPGTSEVSSLSGGGLTWARLSNTVACTGRISQPRGELWWAWGSPSSFSLTVNYANAVRAGAGSHVVVSRISGAANTAPINDDYSNLNGTSGGPSCSGGSDTDTPTLVMTVTNSNSMVFNAMYPRNGSIDTPDADYTQQYFVSHNDGGDATTMGLFTRLNGGGPTDTIAHLINSSRPWFMIGCEIEEGVVIHTASGAPSITKPTATGVARRIVTATGTPSIEKPTAAGSAIRKITATGTPEITKPISNGTARRIVKASGSPSITKPTAQGQGNTAIIIPPGTDARRFREEQHRERLEIEDDDNLAIVIAATTAIIENQD